MSFFSIITICRNNLEELKFTFQSIESQTNKDFEWIVVDGNSQDGTVGWLKSNHLAKWRSEPDKGIFDAMNKGLDRAKGRYLIFMNSGDAFAADTVLDEVHKEITSNSFPGFVYGDSLDIDEHQQQHYRKAKDFKKNWMGMITQHQAMFFSNIAVGKTRYSLEFPITGDYAYISEILKKLDKGDILQIHFPVCKFNMGGTNEQQRFKALKEDYRIRKEIIGLSVIASKILYWMHYLHTILKKKSPNTRFLRHKHVD